MRLHVFLARAGVASRRASEALISDGRVAVNGKTVSAMGTRVEPGKDRVEVDGKPVGENAGRTRYFLFHKPEGVVTTLSDPHADRTVADYFRDIPEKLVPAGRLDKNSTGLVLMTNDGGLVYRLTHPRFGIEKHYLVEIEGTLFDDQLKRLERGIFLQGKKTAPCKVEVVKRKKESTELEMTLREGRKREIREMIKALGSHVLSLHRDAYGPLSLGSLSSGKRRELSDDEIRKLRALL